MQMATAHAMNSKWTDVPTNLRATTMQMQRKTMVLACNLMNAVFAEAMALPRVNATIVTETLTDALGVCWW